MGFTPREVLGFTKQSGSTGGETQYFPTIQSEGCNGFYTPRCEGCNGFYPLHPQQRNSLPAKRNVMEIVSYLFWWYFPIEIQYILYIYQIMDITPNWCGIMSNLIASLNVFIITVSIRCNNIIAPRLRLRNRHLRQTSKNPILVPQTIF